MKPKQLILKWVETFNTADADAMARFYHEDAINHPVNAQPIEGQDAIRNTFKSEFEKATMVCEIENIFEDNNWAILEWKDPLGLRGSSFFMIEDNRIKFQRGYFDLLTFLRIQKLPFPTE